jgi:hypothetical protein
VPEHLRVVVTGSRHWTDEATIERELEALLPRAPIYLGHGGARGADRIAARIAHRLGFDIKPYLVQTAVDGPWPAAGHRRNARMLDTHRPRLVLAFRAPGKSNGTDGCIAAARKRGIRVRVIRSQ